MEIVKLLSMADVQAQHAAHPRRVLVGRAQDIAADAKNLSMATETITTTR
jgi:hypothetical protein